MRLQFNKRAYSILEEKTYCIFYLATTSMEIDKINTLRSF